MGLTSSSSKKKVNTTLSSAGSTQQVQSADTVQSSNINLTNAHNANISFLDGGAISKSFEFANLAQREAESIHQTALTQGANAYNQSADIAKTSLAKLDDITGRAFNLITQAERSDSDTVQETVKYLFTVSALAAAVTMGMKFYKGR